MVIYIYMCFALLMHVLQLEVNNFILVTYFEW